MDLLDGLHASCFDRNDGKSRSAHIASIWKTLDEARYNLAALYDSIGNLSSMIIKTVDLITQAMRDLASVDELGSKAKTQEIESIQEGIIGKHGPHPLLAANPFVSICNVRDKV